MATSSSDHQPARLTVPAAYLEDARSALIAEVDSDAGALRTADEGDRELSTTILRRDMRLLEAVLAATGDVELTAENDQTSNPLIHMLEAMVRQTTERLDAAVQFGPVPMGTVADLVERLQWAAREAVRLDPRLDERLTANEWARAVA